MCETLRIIVLLPISNIPRSVDLYIIQNKNKLLLHDLIAYTGFTLLFWKFQWTTDNYQNYVILTLDGIGCYYCIRDTIPFLWPKLAQIMDATFNALNAHCIYILRHLTENHN